MVAYKDELDVAASLTLPSDITMLPKRCGSRSGLSNNANVVVMFRISTSCKTNADSVTTE